MRHPAPHFDGEPDRIARTRALFSAESRLRVRFAVPDAKRFRWSRLHAMAERAIAKIRRAS